MPDGSATAHLYRPKLATILQEGYGGQQLRSDALAGLTTVNLDFVRQYRAQTNVVTRPTAGTGRGYSLIGHHEIMIPLLAAAVTAEFR